MQDKLNLIRSESVDIGGVDHEGKPIIITL